MIDFRRSKFIWRLMRFLNRRVMARVYGSGSGSGSQSKLGGTVLILTTTGRKSGLRRETPLQYEENDGVYYVAAARGPNADWFRNLAANPNVQVQVGTRRFDARAEPITDPARTADFLEMRLQRRPRMMRAMLRLEGLPANATRAQLEAFAADLAMVAIHPYETNNEEEGNENEVETHEQ
ncbi:MAG: nitroreductase family deazaflavin-dependent oxidoreductase [Anaerolineae bacterium]|nr:nitroreductase family deazaflavin-dependent oxidoreductase [Anaerolineae bacterium]